MASRLRLFIAATAVTVLCFVPVRAAAQQADGGPDRGGFTLLLNLGLGYQNDGALPDAETGLAGLNLGIGGFLTDDLALWFRASGTVVSYPSFTQTSGVGAPALQYWVNDRFNVEGGVGIGFWDVEGVNEGGLGLILGAGYAVFNSGKHNLQIGVEYAPAFTNPETVHNVGVTFGWQLL
jgi:hypothetical protein